MIISVVGSGGKTTLIKKLAAQYRSEGKTVLVTTTTHMFIEKDALLTDDAGTIIGVLQKTGYAMAGIPEGEKIKALSKETFDNLCAFADVILVEADGSKCLPLKYPNTTEPVIPENTDEIIVVCGLNAIGEKAKDVCHRLELVKTCLGVEDDTVITPVHVQKLVTDGYLTPLQKAYPNAKISVRPRHDGSLYQRAIASLLQNEQDVSLIQKEWFSPQPTLFICGGGHVAKEVAATFENLRKAGFSEDQISTIFAPIGLPIGAVTPAEIAFSILGQIIQEKNKHHAASADKALLTVTESGMLCIITEKLGSAPRDVGSMMFVGKERILGSIGGGEPEYRAISHARANPAFSIREYALNRAAANGLDMICSGTIKVVFIPISQC